MARKQVTWNYGNVPTVTRKRRYTDKLGKPASYATEQSKVRAQKLQKQLGDYEYARHLLDDPMGQNNPYLLMGLDRWLQSGKQLKTYTAGKPISTRRWMGPPEHPLTSEDFRSSTGRGVKIPSSVHKYLPKKGTGYGSQTPAGIAYGPPGATKHQYFTSSVDPRDNVYKPSRLHGQTWITDDPSGMYRAGEMDVFTQYQGMTPRESRVTAIHELMHLGSLSWQDIVMSSPELKKYINRDVNAWKEKSDDPTFEMFKYMSLSQNQHPYMYTRERESGGWHEDFRSGMAKRTSLPNWDYVNYPKTDRGTGPSSPEKVRIPNKWVNEIDRIITPYVIDRYPSLRNHPVWRNQKTISKPVQEKHAHLGTWSPKRRPSKSRRYRDFGDLDSDLRGRSATLSPATPSLRPDFGLPTPQPTPKKSQRRTRNRTSSPSHRGIGFKRGGKVSWNY